MKAADLGGLDRSRAVERLTALWALNEAGLGGLIHALRVPFTGVVVGSTAVVLIALIAFFAERKAKAILKAMVVVLLVKAAASPHTPLPAYVAVSFQGLAGALLFGVLPSVRLGALLLGLLALWQGAVQKLLVMTILYGKTLWESVDAVGRWILDKMGSGPGDLSPTGWFLVFYLGYYTLAGLATGWLAGTIPGEIAQALRSPRPAPSAGLETLPAVPLSGKKWWRRAPFRAGLALAALFAVLMLLNPGQAGWIKGLHVLARVLVVMAVWAFVVHPLGAALFRRFRRREQGLYGMEISRAMEQFPALRQAAVLAWRHSAAAVGFQRWKKFLVELTVQALIGIPRQAIEASGGVIGSR
jgi:hypothetical protein